MRTFTRKPKATEKSTPERKALAAGTRAEQNRGATSILQLQRMIGNHGAARRPPNDDSRGVENHTRLPAPLLAGLQELSGLDLSGVRVHRDSSKPAQLNALAYAQGQDIHLGPGQNEHLPHEGWHVVQQMQGRVAASLESGGVPINDDWALEREADIMGTKALRMPGTESPTGRAAYLESTSAFLLGVRGVVQRWEGLEHKKVGNRAQNAFPFRGTITTNMTALRSSPRKDPAAIYDNITVDILAGATVLVLGRQGNWYQVLIESGMVRDKKGRMVSGATLTGYVSGELITKSGTAFDAEIPVGGGLNLSYGDLVAFGGDHFADLREILGEGATPAGRARLKKLRDAIDSEAAQSPVYEDAATVSKEYAERYVNLALENVSHFSRGGKGIETWQKLHSEAIMEAFGAGRQREEAGLTGAYGMNAFADHFLTDSFSSGHIRVPREDIISSYRKLAAEVFGNIIEFLSDRLGTRTYELLEQDYWRVRRFGEEEDRREAVETVRAQITEAIEEAGGMAYVQEQFALYVAGEVSKILHDKENKAGLRVVSKRHPKGWMAFGDANLESPDNATNLAYMEEAVRESKQDLVDAFRIGLKLAERYGKTPPQSATDAAMTTLTRKVGPPYSALELVPSPAPGVQPLPSWEWGNLDPTIRKQIADDVGKYLTTTAQEQLLDQIPEQREVEIRGPNVQARPRDAARDILREFLADPVAFLEQAFGRAASP